MPINQRLSLPSQVVELKKTMLANDKKACLLESKIHQLEAKVTSLKTTSMQHIQDLQARFEFQQQKMWDEHDMQLHQASLKLQQFLQAKNNELMLGYQEEGNMQLGRMNKCERSLSLGYQEKGNSQLDSKRRMNKCSEQSVSLGYQEDLGNTQLESKQRNKFEQSLSLGYQDEFGNMQLESKGRTNKCERSLSLDYQEEGNSQLDSKRRISKCSEQSLSLNYQEDLGNTQLESKGRTNSLSLSYQEEGNSQRDSKHKCSEQSLSLNYQEDLGTTQLESKRRNKFEQSSSLGYQEEGNTQLESKQRMNKCEPSLSSLSVSSFICSELTFSSASPTPQPMHRWSSAVVHKGAVYLIPGRTKKIWKFCGDVWTHLCSCEYENSTLTIVDNALVAIGGQFYSGGDDITYTSNVYTYRRNKWEKELPPMNIARDSVIAMTNGNALIVIGGRGKLPTKKSGCPLKVVEILPIHGRARKWQYARELPFPLYHASITTHGDRLFLLGGFSMNGLSPGNHCVLTCMLTDLLLSLVPAAAPSQVWREASKLPISRSTCVTFGHSLLAIGGSEGNRNPSAAVYVYDEDTNIWNPLARLKTPRTQCFAAVLSNKLFVIGGMVEEDSRLVPHASVEMCAL